jgi:hypothetical protein
MAARVVALTLAVPAKSACSSEQEKVTEGSCRAPYWSLIPLAIATAMRVSVAKGRWGPC